MAQNYTQAWLFDATWYQNNLVVTTLRYAATFTSTPGTFTTNVTVANTNLNVPYSTPIPLTVTVTSGDGTGPAVLLTSTLPGATTTSQISMTNPSGASIGSSSAPSDMASTSQQTTSSALSSTSSNESASHSTYSSVDTLVSGAASSQTTSVATTTSTQEPTQTSIPSHRLSIGGIAGVAIASAIAGAFIAAAVAYFFWRRQPHNKYNTATSNHSSPTFTVPPNKREVIPMGPVMRTVGGGRAGTPVNLLPPPMQESDIEGEFSRIGTAIKNHAQSYFSSNVEQASQHGNQATGTGLSQLLGSECHIDAQTLASMLADPRSRTAVVRFLLAWTILENTKSTAMPEYTLLPPELAESMQRMPAPLHGQEDRDVLLSRWRQLSGLLMSSTYGNKAITPNDSRNHNIQELVNILDSVLRSYASAAGRAEAGRMQNMTELLKRGARFGYTLFTQPTSWLFAWDDPNHSRGFVVYPALLRTADENGRTHPAQRYGAQGQVVDRA